MEERKWFGWGNSSQNLKNLNDNYIKRSAIYHPACAGAKQVYSLCLSEIEYQIFLLTVGQISGWYRRPNTDDQINSKPGDQKMTKQPKKQKP